MKITPLLAASLLALNSLAIAQSPVPVAPEAPQAPVSPAVKKLPAFNSSAATLKTVVAALQEALQNKKLEPINVLISPEAEEAKVPALDLRNVSGPDALSLIASAASCVLEPIRSPSDAAPRFIGQVEPIIGYKLHSESGPGRGGRLGSGGGGKGGGGGDAGALPLLPSSGAMPGGLPAIEGSGPRVPRPPQPMAGSPVGETGIAFYGGGGRAGAGMMSPSPAVETRVYPLATVGASATLAEIEKTIEDVLATSGTPKDQVKLAIHQKTNVLVVRGPAEAQAMVEQLLAALGKNNAGNSDHDATSKITTMTVRLEAMTAEMDRLRKQIAEVEAEQRALEKQNRQLQDQAPQNLDRK